MVDPPVTSTSRSSALTEPENTEPPSDVRAPTASTGLASSRSATVPSCGKSGPGGSATAMSANPLIGSCPRLAPGTARPTRSSPGYLVAPDTRELSVNTYVSPSPGSNSTPEPDAGPLALATSMCDHRGGDGVVDGSPVHAGAVVDASVSTGAVGHDRMHDRGLLLEDSRHHADPGGGHGPDDPGDERHRPDPGRRPVGPAALRDPDVIRPRPDGPSLAGRRSGPASANASDGWRHSRSSGGSQAKNGPSSSGPSSGSTHSSLTRPHSPIGHRPLPFRRWPSRGSATRPRRRRSIGSCTHRRPERASQPSRRTSGWRSRPSRFRWSRPPPG